MPTVCTIVYPDVDLPLAGKTSWNIMVQTETVQTMPTTRLSKPQTPAIWNAISETHMPPSHFHRKEATW